MWQLLTGYRKAELNVFTSMNKKCKKANILIINMLMHRSSSLKEKKMNSKLCCYYYNPMIMSTWRTEALPPFCFLLLEITEGHRLPLHINSHEGCPVYGSKATRLHPSPRHRTITSACSHHCHTNYCNRISTPPLTQVYLCSLMPCVLHVTMCAWAPVHVCVWLPRVPSWWCFRYVLRRILTEN